MCSGRVQREGMGGVCGVQSQAFTGSHEGSEVVARSLNSTVTGHRHHFTVTFAFRWSSDLSEPHQPGGRHFQRGSRGHAEQPRGGAAHYLTAKRCFVCVCVCVCVWLLYVCNDAVAVTPALLCSRVMLVI